MDDYRGGRLVIMVVVVAVMIIAVDDGFSSDDCQDNSYGGVSMLTVSTVSLIEAHLEYDGDHRCAS